MIHLKRIHVRTACLFVLTIILTQSLVVGFYTNTTLSIYQSSRRNITCWTDGDTAGTSTILLSFFAGNFRSFGGSIGDACVFIKQNGNLLNGSQFYAFYAGILRYTNLYRQMTRRCGSNFSSSNTFIGYGRCTPFPYETWTTDLCICSTNDCNLNYSTCVASVQATSSQPPPNLPNFVPELSNIISCSTSSYGSTYAYGYDDALAVREIGVPINMTVYRTYYETHAVACGFLLDENSGTWSRSALLYENYETELFGFLYMNDSSVADQWNESATSVVLSLHYSYETNSSFVRKFTSCYCTTNYCNFNLTTCAAGVNNNLPSSSSTEAATTSHTNTNGCLKQVLLTLDQRFQNFFLLIFIIILHKTI